MPRRDRKIADEPDQNEARNHGQRQTLRPAGPQWSRHPLAEAPLALQSAGGTPGHCSQPNLLGSLLYLWPRSQKSPPPTQPLCPSSLLSSAFCTFTGPQGQGEEATCSYSSRAIWVTDVAASGGLEG